jgi:hypothetical protein
LENKVENLEAEATKQEVETRQVDQEVVKSSKGGAGILKALIGVLGVVFLGVAGFFVWKTMYAGSDTIDNDTTQLAKADTTNIVDDQTEATPKQSDDKEDIQKDDTHPVAQQPEDAATGLQQEDTNTAASSGEVENTDDEVEQNDLDLTGFEETDTEELKAQLEEILKETKILYKKISKDPDMSATKKKKLRIYLVKKVFRPALTYLKELEKGENIDKNIVDVIQKNLDKAKQLMNE